jgi:hypothetical protein
MAVGIQEDDQLDDAQLEVRFAQRAVHGGPSRPSKAWRPIGARSCSRSLATHCSTWARPSWLSVSSASRGGARTERAVGRGVDKHLIAAHPAQPPVEAGAGPAILHDKPCRIVAVYGNP